MRESSSSDGQGQAQAVLVETPETRAQLERLETIADWLDRRYVDPALGFFFPGAGDTLCALVGLYGVWVAVQLRVHPVVIARMLVNLAIDAVVGGVPIVGAIFDLFHRAHVKNLALIHDRGSYGPARASDYIIVTLAAALFLIALLLPLIVLGFLAYWVGHLILS